jgi:hypothetical protein
MTCGTSDSISSISLGITGLALSGTLGETAAHDHNYYRQKTHAIYPILGRRPFDPMKLPRNAIQSSTNLLQGSDNRPVQSLLRMK